ncbi:MAG: methionyl-tRNA formyltransferase, partial [bacterium]|nr:methionyl-tRNA formyltransferase [bacterium]
KKEDGKINWNEPAEHIERQIRALAPWPGTWTFWDKKLLKVLKARVITTPGEYQHTKPGTIFSFESQFAIITKEQALLVEEVQLEGKKPMGAKDFLLGHKDILNSKLGPA